MTKLVEASTNLGPGSTRLGVVGAGPRFAQFWTRFAQCCAASLNIGLLSANFCLWFDESWVAFDLILGGFGQIWALFDPSSVCSGVSQRVRQRCLLLNFCVRPFCRNIALRAWLLMKLGGPMASWCLEMEPAAAFLGHLGRWRVGRLGRDCGLAHFPLRERAHAPRVKSLESSSRPLAYMLPYSFVVHISCYRWHPCDRRPWPRVHASRSHQVVTRICRDMAKSVTDMSEPFRQALLLFGRVRMC